MIIDWSGTFVVDDVVFAWASTGAFFAPPPAGSAAPALALLGVGS